MGSEFLIRICFFEALRRIERIHRLSASGLKPFSPLESNQEIPFLEEKNDPVRTAGLDLNDEVNLHIKLEKCYKDTLVDAFFI